jgi:hypothetical protein
VEVECRCEQYGAARSTEHAREWMSVLHVLEFERAACEFVLDSRHFVAPILVLVLSSEIAMVDAVLLWCVFGNWHWIG